MHRCKDLSTPEFLFSSIIVQSKLHNQSGDLWSPGAKAKPVAGTPKPASTPVSAAQKKQDSSSSEDSSSESEDEAPAKVLQPTDYISSAIML